MADQYQNIEKSFKTNNSKKTHQLIKELTSTKQAKTTIIQDKTGVPLTENESILKRWTDYCSELYNYRTTGDQ